MESSRPAQVVSWLRRRWTAQAPALWWWPCCCCRRNEPPAKPRGSGTSLSDGAIFLGKSSVKDLVGKGIRGQKRQESIEDTGNFLALTPVRHIPSSYFNQGPFKATPKPIKPNQLTQPNPPLFPPRKTTWWPPPLRRTQASCKRAASLCEAFAERAEQQGALLPFNSAVSWWSWEVVFWLNEFSLKRLYENVGRESWTLSFSKFCRWEGRFEGEFLGMTWRSWRPAQVGLLCTSLGFRSTLHCCRLRESWNPQRSCSCWSPLPLSARLHLLVACQHYKRNQRTCKNRRRPRKRHPTLANLPQSHRSDRKKLSRCQFCPFQKLKRRQKPVGPGCSW